MRVGDFSHGSFARVTVSTSPASGVDIAANSLLRTLLLCDLVDSTALVQRLGDREAAELIRKHDRLARTLADRHGGQEIDKTDGFLMMFERPVQAVAFALDYQRGLRQLNAAEKTSLAARVGIHVGDVVVWDNSSEDIAKGAKPVEVEGLVKPVTSRLMNLALPGQILLSNIAYDLAHRAQGELGEQLGLLRWRTHGRYRFRGVPDPVAVFEVGEEGLAPLKAPPWSSKAHREVPFWRRPATVVIEALVVLILIAIPTVMFLRPDPAIAFASRDWVVVGSLNNLTGETVFDDALESALRIGLEQSRYVNVLPELKVRDTITRMQRDPDKTEVNREVGSEVAIRDGARALILPTIAEIGGRVRITAEVIDPQTQTTVYSETADGIGKESILPSLDTINDRLRVRLGEALATVTENSMPLEKVATGNLDALKAYTIGSSKASRGMFAEAEALFEQALKIDQEFASAHLRLAVIYYSAGKIGEALQQLDMALGDRDRLSARDVLFAESYQAAMRHAPNTLQKWQLLVDTYPDFFAATGGFAYMTWRDANRFSNKNIALASSSASSKNPNPLPSKHLLGILYLGNERYAEAEQEFKDIEAAGFGFTHYHAASEAAQRRFEQATDLLAKMPVVSAAENPAASVTRTLFETAFLLDQGKFDEAVSVINTAKSELPAGSTLGNHFDAITLSMRSGLEEGDSAEIAVLLRSGLAQSKEERTQATAREMENLDSRQALFAYLAAHHGDAEMAKRALLHPAGVTGQDYLPSQKLRAIAEAEIARRSGNAQLAVEKLKKMIDGSELYLTHVALLDAYADMEKGSADALQEARWLTSHRGRAYAEAGASNLLTPFNVLQSDLAILRGAELSLSESDEQSARSMLDQFNRSWPDTSHAPSLTMRVKKIQDLLEPDSSP